MVVDTVKWFQQEKRHPGEKRLQETLNQRYHHPRLCYCIDKLNCEDCQKLKLAGRGYGLLPEQVVRIAPWEEVAINLIGTWKVKVNGQQVEFNGLTWIDMASNPVELIRVDNNTAKHYPDKFTQSWLCWYPRPVQCLHDKGGEFIRQNFQWLICERMHQTVTNVLRTLVLYQSSTKYDSS
jgi:hypothetical protein